MSENPIQFASIPNVNISESSTVMVTSSISTADKPEYTIKRKASSSSSSSVRQPSPVKEPLPPRRRQSQEERGTMTAMGFNPDYGYLMDAERLSRFKERRRREQRAKEEQAAWDRFNDQQDRERAKVQNTMILQL